MELGKYSKILFATICVSVIVHFIFRNKSIIEGNTNADDATSEPATETAPTETPATDAPATETPATETSATETPATETSATETPATDSTTEEPQSEPVEECKASGQAGNFDEDCKQKSYMNNDFSSNCAVYGGSTAGDVQCKPVCCTGKSTGQLSQNLKYADFKKQVDNCKEAEHENELVCRALDRLAESRATNMVLREKQAAEHIATYDTNPDNAQTSTVISNTQCQPDRASAFTREANVGTGFFNNRPREWPFPRNSNNYDNHLTGCNCPPCDKYKDPNQTL